GQGGYQYFVLDTFGCRWLQFFDLPSPDKITIELPPSIESMRCDTVQIEATTNASTPAFAWTPTDYLSCTECPNPSAKPFLSTTYQLTVTDSNGCSAMDSIRVVVGFDPHAHIPNAFSPNGDNTNDVFYVLGDCVQEVRLLRIFDRWGEMVFEATNTQPMNRQFGWDGRLKGKDAAADVYIYQIIVLLGDGSEKAYKGDLTLLR
ncbi:MAG: gliding motility-associated C-terminal domain-containing protein, partial [Saprospiraceae bacterium]|nr:gliding motility-associated C-terminal domain-containing protein [Saprospiraceae bacterium]